jgi:hypothetical protein
VLNRNRKRPKKPAKPKKKMRTAGTHCVWPSGIEQRYGIKAVTRWRWERDRKLPMRDVFVDGVAVGWRPETPLQKRNVPVAGLTTFLAGTRFRSMRTILPSRSKCSEIDKFRRRCVNCGSNFEPIPPGDRLCDWCSSTSFVRYLAAVSAVVDKLQAMRP